MRFSSLSVDVAIDTPRGIATKTFAIATTAIIVDEVHPRDRVNVTYEKRLARLVVVCLQRIPSIDFDGAPGRGSEGQHFGVSEMVLPDSESSRLMAKVGDPLELRTRDWELGQTGGGGPGGGGEGGSGGPEQKRESGTVVSIQKLTTVESKLVVNTGEAPNSFHLSTYVLDLTTSVHGRLSKGVHVTVTSTLENDRRYAVEVTTKTVRH